MQLRSYDTRSLSDASAILSREWSAHKISICGNSPFHMQFKTRNVSSDMSLSSLSFATDIRIDPICRDKVLLLKMPRCGTEIAQFADRTVVTDPNCYAVIDVKQVSHVESDELFSTLVLRLKMSRVLAYLESTLDITANRDVHFTGEIASGTQQWEMWAPISTVLHSLNSLDGADISTLILAPLEEAVIAALLLAQNNNYTGQLIRPKTAVAPKHVKRAETYMMENAHKPLTTELIARHAGVSVRSLFNGFQSFRGMSPAQYLRRVRLEKARSDLFAQSGSTAEIANRWGFGHTGNFAAHYRRRYGENPAETLRFRSRPKRR